MENETKDEVLAGLYNILNRQIILECQIDALKMTFHAMLSQLPGMDATIHDRAYKAIALTIFENKMGLLKEQNAAYSDEITEQMRSLLKGMPGIILPSIIKKR